MHSVAYFVLVGLFPDCIPEHILYLYMSLSYLNPGAYFVFVRVSFVFESKGIFCICRPPGAYRLSRVRTDVGLEQRQACRLQPTISSGGHTRDCVPPCVCLPHHLVFIIIIITRSYAAYGRRT